MRRGLAVVSALVLTLPGGMDGAPDQGRVAVPDVQGLRAEEPVEQLETAGFAPTTPTIQMSHLASW